MSKNHQWIPLSWTKKCRNKHGSPKSQNVENTKTSDVETSVVGRRNVGWFMIRKYETKWNCYILWSANIRNIVYWVVTFFSLRTSFWPETLHDERILLTLAAFWGLAYHCSSVSTSHPAGPGSNHGISKFLWKQERIWCSWGNWPKCTAWSESGQCKKV